MSWFSILPASLAFIETWLIKIFILLGLLSIGPWFLLVLYDLILYIFRVSTYEVPYVGGRARNRPRPRAPSLRVPTAVDGEEETMGNLKKRGERTAHERSGSKSVLDAE